MNRGRNRNQKATHRRRLRRANVERASFVLGWNVRIVRDLVRLIGVDRAWTADNVVGLVDLSVVMSRDPGAAARKCGMGNAGLVRGRGASGVVDLSATMIFDRGRKAVFTVRLTGGVRVGRKCAERVRR